MTSTHDKQVTDPYPINNINQFYWCLQELDKAIILSNDRELSHFEEYVCLVVNKPHNVMIKNQIMS